MASSHRPSYPNWYKAVWLSLLTLLNTLSKLVLLELPWAPCAVCWHERLLMGSLVATQVLRRWDTGELHAVQSDPACLATDTKHWAILRQSLLSDSWKMWVNETHALTWLNLSGFPRYGCVMYSSWSHHFNINYHVVVPKRRTKTSLYYHIAWKTSKIVSCLHQKKLSTSAWLMSEA